jgi:hypothetical protein
VRNVFGRDFGLSGFLGRGRKGLRRRRRLAGATSLTLTASLVTVFSLPVPAGAAQVAKPACPASRPDEASAVMTARMCGGRVLVAGDESATSLVYALPDGSLEASTAMAPQRVRQSDGSWKPVDVSLRVNADRSVGPAMAAFPASLAGAASAAGDHELASTGSGTGKVAVHWNGALPTPVLSGNTATYPEVKPGIDLVVSVNASGIEQNVVVKTRAALAQVTGLSLPVVTDSTTSYSAGAHGGLAFKDKAGHALASVPPMRMWDAKVDPATGQPVARALAVRLSKRAAKAGKAGVDLALTPDAAWLNDPARVFPIILDPAINPELTTFDTFVQQGSTTDFSGDNDLQFGTTSGNVTRSFLSWDTSQLENAVINSATVNF